MDWAVLADGAGDGDGSGPDAGRRQFGGEHQRERPDRRLPIDSDGASGDGWNARPPVNNRLPLGAQTTLAELAADLGLSPFHFARAFKRSTGVPPHRYLVQLRLERAGELLTGTKLPVTDIAARVGYDDPGYLSRLFRHEFGMTPAQYRRERQRPSRQSGPARPPSPGRNDH